LLVDPSGLLLVSEATSDLRFTDVADPALTPPPSAAVGAAMK
jgi:hypothetical protein